MRFSAVVLLLPYLLMTACYRGAERDLSTYTIINKLPVAVTLDVYPSMDDYYLQANREARYELQPQAKLKFSLSSYKTYGIDWYSKDYTYNNWSDPKQHYIYTNNALPLPTLKTHGTEEYLDLRVAETDSSRSILLNGDGRSSTWKAVNEDNTPHKGTHLFELSKDFRCRHTIIDSSGTHSQDYAFLLTQNSATFELTIEDSAKGYVVELRHANIPGTWYDRDTLTLWFSDSPGGAYYPAVRQ
jgi:hypothetical protein